MDEFSKEEIELIVKQLNRIEQDIANGSYTHEQHYRMAIAVPMERVNGLYDLISDIVKTTDGSQHQYYPNITKFFKENNIARGELNSYPQMASRDSSMQNMNDLFIFTIDTSVASKKAEFDFKFKFDKYGKEDILNGSQQFDNLAELIANNNVEGLNLPIAGSADVNFETSKEKLSEAHKLLSSLPKDLSFDQVKSAIEKTFGSSFLGLEENISEAEKTEQLTQFLASTVYGTKRSLAIAENLHESLNDRDIEAESETARVEDELAKHIEFLKNALTDVGSISYKDNQEQLLSDYRKLVEHDAVDDYANVTPKSGDKKSTRDTPDLTITFTPNDDSRFNIDDGDRIRVMGQSNIDTRDQTKEEFERWKVQGGSSREEHYQTTVIAENNGYINSEYGNNETYAKVSENLSKDKSRFGVIDQILQGEVDLDNVRANDNQRPSFDPIIDVRANPAETQAIVNQVMNKREKDEVSQNRASEELTGKHEEDRELTAGEKLEEHVREDKNGYEIADTKQARESKEVAGLVPDEYQLSLDTRIELDFFSATVPKPNLRIPGVDSIKDAGEGIRSTNPDPISKAIVASVFFIGGETYSTINNTYALAKAGAQKLYQEIVGTSLTREDKELLSQVADYVIIEALELDKNDQNINLTINSDKFLITSAIIGSNQKYQSLGKVNKSERHERDHIGEVEDKYKKVQDKLLEEITDKMKDIDYLENLRNGILEQDFSLYSEEPEIGNNHKQKILDNLAALIEMNRSEPPASRVSIVNKIVQPLVDNFEQQELLTFPKRRSETGEAYITFAIRPEQAKIQVVTDIQGELSSTYNYIYKYLDRKSIRNPDLDEYPEIDLRRMDLRHLSQEEKHQATRELLREFVEDNGYQIRFDENGKLDLEHLKSQDYEALLETRKGLFSENYDRGLMRNEELTQDLDNKIYALYVKSTGTLYNDMIKEIIEGRSNFTDREQTDLEEDINNDVERTFVTTFMNVSSQNSLKKLAYMDRGDDFKEGQKEQLQEDVLDYLIYELKEKYGNDIHVGFDGDKSINNIEIRLNLGNQNKDEARILRDEVREFLVKLKDKNIIGELKDSFNSFLEAKKSTGFNLSPEELGEIVERLATIDKIKQQNISGNPNLKSTYVETDLTFNKDDTHQV